MERILVAIIAIFSGLNMLRDAFEEDGRRHCKNNEKSLQKPLINGLGFAGLPQTKIQWFQPSGTPANENPNNFSPAGLPQIKIQTISARRDSRKRKSK